MAPADYITRAFDRVRQAGASSPTVAMALLNTIAMLHDVLEEAGRRRWVDSLRHQARMTLEGARHSTMVAADFQDVLGLAERLPPLLCVPPMPISREPVRYDRDTPEFARVGNLSDAVFAIAMTLLVLTLDTPATAAGDLAGAMLDQLPQLVAFVLAFALVANLWWQHHKLMALFQAVEPGMVGIGLALLGAVALVPYPTSLVGNAPGERLAVLAFIAVFVLLSVLFLLLVVRARAVAAFRDGVSDRDCYLMLGQWSAGIVVLLVAALLTLWLPGAGLSVLASTIILGPLAARRGTTGRHRLMNRYLPEE